LPPCGTFHNPQDARLNRADLVEDIDLVHIASTSFTPGTWECLSCLGHKILPRKRNLTQWTEGSKLILLTDQNFSPIIPSVQGCCPAIIRMEDGSLGELGDSLCTLLGDFALPEGTIIAIASLSHLQRVGLAVYADKLVSECRRFRAMFKGQVTTVPFTPMPLCGSSDPNLIRLLMDLSLYLDSFRGAAGKAYNAGIRSYIEG
jgi:hypothetical protein